MKGNLRGWHVDVLGRAAVMVPQARGGIRLRHAHRAARDRRGGLQLTLERDRKNYRHWAEEFDRNTTRLVGTLRRQGAEQIVWVTLRNSRRSVVPSSARWQFDKYSWYFPYVNERLRLLDKRNADVVLADSRASRTGRITYDVIHLDPTARP